MRTGQDNQAIIEYTFDEIHVHIHSRWIHCLREAYRDKRADWNDDLQISFFKIA